MIITALSANLCEPKITETAQFCLDVALSAGSLSQIWVLGGTQHNLNNLKLSYPDIDIKQFQLDNKVWPQDVGANPMLSLPMTLNQAFYGMCDIDKIDAIYMPLNGACGYFLQMAQRGGLLPYPVKLITTCYLPKTFELSARLVLPTDLSDVVTSEMEILSAQHSAELWITSPLVKASITHKLGISDKNIRLFKPDITAIPAQNIPPSTTRHLIYIGPQSPIYGIDTFCELAEDRDKNGKLDTVTIVSPPSSSDWSKSTQKRLSVLKAEVKWQSAIETKNGDSETSPGIVICPMRAPVLPSGVRSTLSRGIPCIWGQGFDVHLPENSPAGLHCAISDIRKIHAKLEQLENGDENTPLPTALSIPQTSKTITPAKKRSKVESLSVIIIHHNRPDKLRQALESLANQTLKTFEIVLVDDGSTNTSIANVRAILDEFDFHKANLYQIENSYPSAARNHGVMKSTGSALFFLDDDNILDPRTLEAFLNALQTNDLVQSFYQIFEGDSAPTLTQSDTLRPVQHGLSYGFAGALAGAGLFLNIIGNSSFMMRRDTFLDLGGFTPKYGVGLEDYAFILKASQRQDLRWVILPEPYLHFRLHTQKIRNSHVDWRSPLRLQAGHWRLFEDLQDETLNLSPVSLAYARQLHELTQYSYVHSPRPKYFRLKSILLHQYIRPTLARHKKLRELVTNFTSSESRLAKWLERTMTR